MTEDIQGLFDGEDGFGGGTDVDVAGGADVDVAGGAGVDMAGGGTDVDIVSGAEIGVAGGAGVDMAGGAGGGADSIFDQLKYENLEDVDVDELINKLNEVAGKSLYDLPNDDSAVQGGKAAAAAALVGSGGPIANAEAVDDISTDTSKKNSVTRAASRLKSLFARFTAARIAITISVVLACACAGIAGTWLITGGQGKNVQKDPAPAYIPSVLQYNLVESIKDSVARRQDNSGADTDKTQSEIAGAPETQDRKSIIKLLYPLSDEISNGYYTNYIVEMTGHIAKGGETGKTTGAAGGPGASAGAGEPAEPGIPAGPGASAELGVSAESGIPAGPGASAELGESAESGIPAGPGASADKTASNTGKDANPLIAVHDPFPTKVLSFMPVDDIMIAGSLDITNGTDMLIENAYFELTLNYIFSTGPEQRVVYAYEKNLNLAPGENRAITFATVPPVNGVTEYSLANVTLTAFDTHIGGESVKLYYDTDESCLEVLAFDI